MKFLRLLVSLSVSGIFLFLAFRHLDLLAIRNSLSQVQWLWLLPAALIHLGSFGVRSIRWGTMFKHIKSLSCSSLFPSIAISYMANNTLPMRAGDFIRAFLVGRDESVSKTAAFASIILERVCDGITLLLFLGAVLLLAPLPGWAKQVGVLASIIFTGTLGMMLGLVFFREFTLRVIGKLLGILPRSLSLRLEGFLLKLVSGLDVLRDGRALLKVFLWSFGVWGCEALTIALALKSCNITIFPLAVLFTLVIINLGTMIPSSPGYIGTFEFFCTKSLVVFGILAPQAMSAALILHMVQYFPITLTGVAFFVLQSSSLRSISIEKGV